MSVNEKLLIKFQTERNAKFFTPEGPRNGNFNLTLQPAVFRSVTKPAEKHFASISNRLKWRQKLSSKWLHQFVYSTNTKTLKLIHTRASSGMREKAGARFPVSVAGKHTMDEAPCIVCIFQALTHNWHTQLVAVLNEIFPDAHATFKLRQRILVAAGSHRLVVLLLVRRLMLLLMFLGRRCIMVVVAVGHIMTILRMPARALHGTIVKSFAWIKSQTIFVVWLGRHIPSVAILW